MSEIIPAILETNLQELERKLAIALQLSKTIHIDVGDGDFVEVVTPKPGEIRVPAGASIEWHLMVSDPAALAPSAPSLVIIHAEIGNLNEAVTRLKQQGHKVAIALNGETPIQTIADLVPQLDQITVMTVKPGKQGQPFQDLHLEKIKALKTQFPHVRVEVDGGVSRTTAMQAVAAGADRLIAGSALWKTSDPAGAWRELNGLIRS